jgi:HK97 family phage portal protein
LGLLDKMFGPIPQPEVRADDSAQTMERMATTVSDIVNDAIAARQANVTMTDALELAPVQRGLNLITTVGASFPPLVYRNGSALDAQPRIVKRPNPYRTRYEFMAETLHGLAIDGSIVWYVTARDRFGFPTAIVPIPKDDVTIEGYAASGVPKLRWGTVGKNLDPDDYRIVKINPRPGEVWGHSPLREGLPHLSAILAAEDYATGFFASGGLPEIVLKVAAALSKDEAELLKQQFVASRNGTPEPMVASGGVEPMFPTVDPQRAQMQESRAYGATVVARLMGIPAPLLHVETSGATLTYQNAQAAVSELVKATIAPMYLAPIEQVWSDLVPNTQVVRFDLAELERADIASRISMYSTAIASQILTTEEARAFEGWSPTKTESGHNYEPAPSPESDNAEIPTNE